MDNLVIDRAIEFQIAILIPEKYCTIRGGINFAFIVGEDVINTLDDTIFMMM